MTNVKISRILQLIDDIPSEVKLTKYSSSDNFYLTLFTEECTDKYGCDWKKTELCVAITKEELLKLKEMIDELSNL